MSYDLCIGFREKPSDLDRVLAEQGFEHTSTRKPDKIFKVEIKTFFHNTGILFDYHDGLYGDEQWESLYGIKGIVSQGTLSRNFSNDNTKQEEIGKFLRDYYNAILENPQTAKLVID